MVHLKKRKSWKVALLYATPLVLTLATTCFAQGIEHTPLQHQDTVSQQQQDMQQNYDRIEIDRIEQGRQLYEQALQQLETLSKSQHTSSSDSKNVPLINSSGFNGLFHRASDAIWRKAETYLTLHKADGDLHQESASSSNTDQQILQHVTQLLEKAGSVYGNKDALFVLAEMYFYEKYTQPRDYQLAFNYYQQLANTGNATAQQMLGFMYSTGIGNVIQRDQAQAFLYHSFAAHGGDTAAEMTLGYRYLVGIGTDQSCKDAAYYYKTVASKAVEHYLSGPPGGLAPPLMKIRLADDNGGIYGYGASVMTDKTHRGTSDKSVSIEEVLQYLRYLASHKGDIEAQLRLGEIYYHGSRNVPKDFKEALYFFKAVVNRLPSGKLQESFIKSEVGKATGQAAGYLGKMFMRGEGVSANIEMAYKWFVIGTELQDAASMNGLGLIQLNGDKKDYEKALIHFKQAAKLKNSDARVNLALEYMKHDATMAEGIKLLELAVESSKHLLAYWYLGEIYEKGLGMERPSCRHAVSFYKAIAERGDWLYPTIDIAYEAYMRGDIENALVSYMLAAERGYEIAQSNVAYLLDTDKEALNIPQWLGLEESHARDNYTEQLALIYWSRSANQNNVDSRVKMGDYYYKGIGTNVDYDKAAACYRVAAELEVSPMAMWNLGWMYENGIGVSKDFHLAKRAYDNALTVNGNAYLPVKLSLIKLYTKYYWERLTGHDVDHGLFLTGKQKGNPSSQPKQLHDSLWDDTQPHELAEEVAAIEQARRRKEIEGQEEGSEHWGDRTTEDELRRQYNRHKEMEEYEDYDDIGGDSRMYHGDDRMLNKDADGDSEDELIESLIILGICLLVGWLVYVRQFRFGRNNNDNNNNDRQNDSNQEARANNNNAN